MLGPALLYDIDRLQSEASMLKREFATATPFPHLVIDGAIRLSDGDLGTWPDADWEGWSTLKHAYSPQKRQADDLGTIPEPMSSLIRQMSEPRFLRVLEEITGIKKLIPDPYLSGGGLHMSGPGGVLNPHTDFHHYRGLDLYRRVNVLIYFNDEWTLKDGGCLSLYDKPTGTAARTVVPAWGRMVIFKTDDRSLHGFPEPISPGKWRRSIALYYYTSAEATEFSGDATTYWMETQRQSGMSRRARFAIYRSLLNLSRAISVLAHLANPNQGVGLLRSILDNRKKAASR